MSSWLIGALVALILVVWAGGGAIVAFVIGRIVALGEQAPRPGGRTDARL